MYFSLLDFHLDKDKVFLKKNIAFNKTFISLPLDEGTFISHIIHWDKSVIGVFAPLSVLSAFHGASPKLCGNSPRQRPALSLFTERQHRVVNPKKHKCTIICSPSRQKTNCISSIPPIRLSTLL